MEFGHFKRRDNNFRDRDRDRGGDQRDKGSDRGGDHDHYSFMNDVFGLYAHVNILQRDICPSATRYEGEILAMALDLFHAEAVTDGEPAGLLTSGGSGSIAHAVLAYREVAAATRGVTRPNFIKPETGHPAFDKAVSERRPFM